MNAPKTRTQTAGIVLAGTHPWTNSAFDKLPPRALLPIAHRPLISYALSWLEDGGIHQVAVCANRETQTLETSLHRHVPAGTRVSYHEDAMPRGAAGAVRDAAAADDAETFVVTDGTAIPTVDLRELLSSHHESGALVTVVVNSERSRDSKPPVQVPTGVYVFNRAALDFIPANGFFDIKENLIPLLYRSGARVRAYATADASPRVLDAASYLAVNEWMVDRLVTNGAEVDGYRKSGSCLIHREAEIADDVVFVGPVVVGPGARIRSGAVVVGPSSIGREATLGSHVLVSRSAVWRRSTLGDHAVADRCIVADDHVVAAGSQTLRAVMASDVRREHAGVSATRPAAEDAPSFDLLRRMGRALIGTSWSRSPAAQ
jgi:NDP-sugar pyrophosphorylase family protein